MDHTAAYRGRRQQRWLFMFTLILAGECVFALPFHIARFSRPTVLEVFGFTNTQLGTAQGMYGVVAMLAYFPAGRWRTGSPPASFWPPRMAGLS